MGLLRAVMRFEQAQDIRLLGPGYHGTNALAVSLVISVATRTTSGCTSRHQLKELLSAEAATWVLIALQ
jgi:hypothetical protein